MCVVIALAAAVDEFVHLVRMEWMEKGRVMNKRIRKRQRRLRELHKQEQFFREEKSCFRFLCESRGCAQKLDMHRRRQRESAEIP